MLLAPSDIHFVRGLTLDAGSMSELSARFLHRVRHIPKVQVARKDGSWFALNNGYLRIARDLERRGRCDEVRVEVVPLSRVPTTLHGGMVADGHRVPPTCAHLANLEEDTSSYTSSDYSDEEDCSDSEFDEDLSCNVCERSFSSGRLLAQHQQSRRHFGCSVCSCCFPDLRSLEHHKESLDHWSEDDGGTYASDDQPEKSEETERLL